MDYISKDNDDDDENVVVKDEISLEEPGMSYQQETVELELATNEHDEQLENNESTEEVCTVYKI